MKQLIFVALLVTLLPLMAIANVNLGIKKADEFIVIPLLTLDSAGVDKAPDSIQILTWLDGGTGLQFSASNTTFPFDGISIDTSKIFADTTYWLVEQIQDIDGSPTPTQYSLAIDVITWTSVIATHNRATVQVIVDTLQNYLDSTALSTAAAGADATWDELVSGHAVALSFGDSLIQAIDGQGVIVTTNNDKTGYDLNADQSAVTVGTVTTTTTATNVTNLAVTAVDDIWDADTSTADNAAGFGFALKLAADNSTSISTEVTNIGDTLEWVYRSKIADISNVDAGSTPTTTGFTSAAFDQADDYWIGNQVMFVEGAIAGQVAGIIDFTATTDSFTVAPAFSVAPATEDSFIVLTGLWEELASAADIADSVWDEDTTGHFTAGRYGLEATTGAIGAADIVAIADTIFSRDSSDVNAAGATSFGTLMMEPTYVQGSGSGLDSATHSRIMHRVMWGTSKSAGSDSSTAAERDIGTTANLTTNNDKTGYTLTAANINTIAGESADSVWEELVDQHTTALTFGDTLTQPIIDEGVNLIQWVGTAVATVTNVGGQNVIKSDVRSWRSSVPKDLTGDSAVRVDVKGISLDTIAANNMELWFDDGGFDASNSTIGTATNLTTNNDKTGYTLTAAEWERVWFDIDTVNVDSSKIGEWLVNNLAVAGALSAADIVAIADTIFHRDSSDVNDGDATSFGTLLMKPTYVQGSAAGLDSQVVSNIMHRVGWGTPRGSGSDSSTLAERDVTTADILTDVIGSDEIATDAIGSAEFAATAVNEIADTVWTADTTGNKTATGFGRILGAVLDTLNLQDDWVAQEASLFDPATDSTMLFSENMDSLVDRTWDEPLTQGTHDVPQSSGKRIRDIEDATIITEGQAQAGDATSITLAAVTSFADGILAGNRIVLIGGTGSGQTRHIETWTSSTDIATLHPGDDWTVNPDATTEYKVEPSAPSDVAHIGDSALSEIWNFDTVTVTVAGGIGMLLRDTASAIIDSLNNQDDYILKLGDSAEYMNTKSMGGEANTTSPGNLDEAFDGDATGSAMELTRLRIVASGDDTAFVARGSGAGFGGFFIGGTNRAGLNLVGGGTNADGLTTLGVGTGDGTTFQGGATGAGFNIAGGTGGGLTISAISGDLIESAASDEIGLATWNTSATTAFTANSMGDSAIGGINTWGQGGGGAGLTAADIVAIADTIYHRDSSDANDGAATSMGVLFAKEAYMSGSGGVSAADIVAIADTIFHRDSSDVNDGDATSFGTRLMDVTYVQGSGSDTLSTVFVDRLAGRIADTTWESLHNARDDVSGSFADSSKTWGLQVDLTSIPGADISITYRAIDTGNAVAIQGVSISAYNLSDVRVAFGTTPASGEVVFGFKLNDSVYFNSSGPVGYSWTQNDTLLLVQNGDIDTTEGFLFTADDPATGKTAAVTVFVLNNDRTPAVNVAVSAYLSRSNVIDSAGFPVYNQTQTEFTDSDGKVVFTCIWSSYMIPATKWYFSTSVPGTIKKKITIPRNASITLDLR